MGTKDENVGIIRGHAKKIINLIAIGDYESVEKHVDYMKNWSVDSLAGVIENFKVENNIEQIDTYDDVCIFNRKYQNEYKQETINLYSDNSGYSYEYELTTGSKPNNLVLNLEFIFEGKEFKVVFERGIII